MSPGSLCMAAADVRERVDENTIFVVPTMGVTYHGLYEDVAGIAAALDDYEAKTGIDIPIHVDAASGGFLAPFTAPDGEPWDFRLPRVKSINASGHKFGLAPLGVGWVMWRTPADLPDDLVFHVSYLGGDMPTFQINFSRPAGQVISQYYDFVRLGREGYAAIHGQAHAVAQACAAELASHDCFRIVHDGDPAKHFRPLDIPQMLSPRGMLTHGHNFPHKEGGVCGECALCVGGAAERGAVGRGDVGAEAHERHFFDVRAGGEARAYCRDGDGRGARQRKAVGAGADRREGHGLQAMLRCDFQRARVAGAEQRVFVAGAAAPHRTHGVDDVARRQPVAGGDPGIAGGAAAQGAAFVEQAGPGGAVDGAVDPAAAEQRSVGGVDDRVHGERGEIALDNAEQPGHDATLTAPIPDRKLGHDMGSPRAAGGRRRRRPGIGMVLVPRLAPAAAAGVWPPRRGVGRRCGRPRRAFCGLGRAGLRP